MGSSLAWVSSARVLLTPPGSDKKAPSLYALIYVWHEHVLQRSLAPLGVEQDVALDDGSHRSCH
jgi:hypothetical protein